MNWAPSTQATASTMLDLPVPLGPTTTDTPGSNSSRVRSANDLKPASFRDLRYKSHPCNCAAAHDSGHLDGSGGNRRSRPEVTYHLLHGGFGYPPQVWQSGHR